MNRNSVERIWKALVAANGFLENELWSLYQTGCYVHRLAMGGMSWEKAEELAELDKAWLAVTASTVFIDAWAQIRGEEPFVPRSLFEASKVALLDCLQPQVFEILKEMKKSLPPPRETERRIRQLLKDYGGRLGSLRIEINTLLQEDEHRLANSFVPITYVESGGTYVEKSITTNVSGHGNIVNVAEYMQNVSNQVTSNLLESSLPTEAKDLVRQLTEQIGVISDQVDPTLTQRMGKNLKKLSEEMAEPLPDRAWYGLSLKGIKEAAETLGTIAEPIIATVGKLMPLLLGI